MGFEILWLRLRVQPPIASSVRNADRAQPQRALRHPIHVGDDRFHQSGPAHYSAATLAVNTTFGQVATGGTAHRLRFDVRGHACHLQLEETKPEASSPAGWMLTHNRLLLPRRRADRGRQQFPRSTREVSLVACGDFHQQLSTARLIGAGKGTKQQSAEVVLRHHVGIIGCHGFFETRQIGTRAVAVARCPWPAAHTVARWREGPGRGRGSAGHLQQSLPAIVPCHARARRNLHRQAIRPKPDFRVEIGRIEQKHSLIVRQKIAPVLPVTFLILAIANGGFRPRPP